MTHTSLAGQKFGRARSSQINARMWVPVARIRVVKASWKTPSPRWWASHNHGLNLELRILSLRLCILQTALRARLHSLLELQQHLISSRALLLRRQQHPLPRSELLQQLQVLLLLCLLRPTAAGQAVEKRLTNECCAVPRHAVSRRGESAAGAAAGAQWSRNKVYTGFAHECAVHTRDAKLQKSLLTVWSEAEKVYTTDQNIEK